MKTTITRIPCVKTFTIRLGCVIAAITLVTPALAQMRETDIKESQIKTQETKAQVGKVIAGYVVKKGSIEKAAQDFIK